jgi:hypothetical protein
MRGEPAHDEQTHLRVLACGDVHDATLPRFKAESRGEVLVKRKKRPGPGRSRTSDRTW